MDGSSRLKQHDNVHQQIAAFEKLLQHAINRFSTEKLYQMMHVILSALPYIPRPTHPRARHADESSDEVSSLAHVREIVDEFKNPQRRGIEKDEETHVTKYFETFFEDIYYLKSLKHYFDKKVYVCLYEYFYDPEDDTLDPRAVLDREKRGRVTFDVEPDSGNSSLPGSDEDGTSKLASARDESPPEVELEFYFEKLTDKEKLSVAVRKMFEINDRWDALFEETDIDPALFDPDSRHEILQFTNYDQFENVLRLVPDLFVKAYKSVELAKLWWTQANKIYDVLPQGQTKKRTESEITERIFGLEKKLTDIRDEIRRHEELLLMQNVELERLTGRENRYLSLSKECESLEGRKNDTGDRYNRILAQRNQLKDSLEGLNPCSPEYQAKQEELRQWERRFFDAQVELRMLTFQFQLIQSDFLMELQLRPDLIRFQTDIETRIEDTQDAILNKTGEERDSEKRLTLLKTNCERMRVVMKRVLKAQGQAEGGDGTGSKNKKKVSGERKECDPELTVVQNPTTGERREQKRDALDKTNRSNRDPEDGVQEKEMHRRANDDHKKQRLRRDETRESKKVNNQDKDNGTRYDRRKVDDTKENTKPRRTKKRTVADGPEDDLTTDDGNLADTDTSTPMFRSVPR